MTAKNASTIAKLCKIVVANVRKRYGKDVASPWAYMTSAIRYELVNSAIFNVVRGGDGQDSWLVDDMDRLSEAVHIAFGKEID